MLRYTYGEPPANPFKRPHRRFQWVTAKARSMPL